MKIENIVIIGSGHLAANLGHVFRKANKQIITVFSPNNNHAAKLASQLETTYTDDFTLIPSDADLYLISITDKAIAEVAGKLKVNKGIVVHTSGTVTMSVLEKNASNFGVFYPLMHFSSDKIIDFTNVPLCIEASNPEVEKSLAELAHEISDNVHLIETHQRKILHLSAVFASNFTNLNYTIAEDLLKQNNLSFDMLRPIIMETATKVLYDSPQQLQTGPAIRGDKETIKEHFALLEKYPDYEEIYKLLTEKIIQQKKNEL